MGDMSVDLYLWFKALHIISVIAWMAGLLYLPRLFVYHCEADKDSDLSETLKVMEGRLFKFIMRPARIATIVFGGLLFLDMDSDQWLDLWVLMKMACVLLLLGIHDINNKWRKAFLIDKNIHSQKFYKIMNEVPTILMILAIFCVIFKPV
jgi:putative membrane protein